MRSISSMVFWPTSARIRSPVGAVEGEAVGVAQPVGVDLGHLARPLERVGRRDAVLAVGADRVGAAGRQGRVERVEPQHFAQRRAQVLGVAARLDVARRRRRWRFRRRPVPDTDSRPGRTRSCRRCDCCAFLPKEMISRRDAGSTTLGSAVSIFHSLIDVLVVLGGAVGGGISRRAVADRDQSRCCRCRACDNRGWPGC